MTEAEIKSRVHKKLEIYEASKTIIWYERLNVGIVQTKFGSWMWLCRQGTPDYICIFKNKSANITVLFIEIKRSEGGTWTKEQREFNSKYCQHIDINYCLINDADDIDGIILTMCYDKVAEMEL